MNDKELMEKYLSNFNNGVAENVTIVTASELGQRWLYHISLDPKIKQFGEVSARFVGGRVGNEVRNDLRIGLGKETMPLSLQFVAQFLIVFDNAVVDDRYISVTAHVRVRVAGRDAAVRRPAGVRDGDGRP